MIQSQSSPEDAQRFLALLARPGDVFELRALSKRNGKQQIAAGFFDDMGALAQAAIARSGREDGIYITLNPVHPGLLSRLPANRIHQVGNGDSTSDRDVIARRHLLIDIDPIRPAGISSDDVEHAAALALATRMQVELAALDWPEPLVADSGNGAHLVYAIDLPRDDGKLVERVLAELSRRYSTPQLKVDEKVFNPARISKIYGTLTRKGQSTPDRPHRIARICSTPRSLEPIPRHLLEGFAPVVARPSSRPAAPTHSKQFDLQAWISRYLPDAEEQSWTGGEHGQRKWLIPTCPFNSTHDRKEAFIVEMHSGAISAGCKHDSCFKSWRELRERFEPGVYERPTQTPAEPRPVYEPRTYRLTQIGNAERFADANVHRMRYVHNWKSWLAWDGRRWRRDETGAEAEAAKLVVEQLFAEAGDARALAEKIAKEHADVIAQAAAGGQSKEDREKRATAKATDEYQRASETESRAHHILEWATASSYASAVKAMIELAKSDPRLVAIPDGFDSDLWSINVLNGTVDLRTGELRTHSQSDMITRIANVEYDPEASCERWETFLDQIMPDVQMRDWLQRFMGYALTGSIDEQSLMFAVGVGQNGKNTFFDTFVTMLGDYATYAAPDLLVLRNSDEHPTGFADLQGRRLVVVSEIDHGRKWAEATIKRLTGDKYVKARFMKKDFFTFLNTLKFCIMANSRPEVRGTDNGIWRRMKVVPFLTSIADAARDDKLMSKLEAERAGIFAWAVRGCSDWRAGGLGKCKIIEDATAAYRRDQDMIGEWLAERCWCVCSISDQIPDADVPGICARCGCAIEEGTRLRAVTGGSPDLPQAAAADIQADYEVWCKTRNDEPWTWRSVRAELLKRPWLTYHRTSIFRGIQGIRLRFKVFGWSNRQANDGNDR